MRVKQPRKKCKVEECKATAERVKHQLCHKHYNRMRRHGSFELPKIEKITITCDVEECDEPHIARGYCQNHYRVFMRNGSPTPPKKELKVHTSTGGYKFKTINRKTRYLHVMAAEKVLGRELRKGEEVHHIDHDPANNNNSNLVICPSHEYHMLLHQRERSIAATGDPNKRPCRICTEYDDTEKMRPYRRQYYHASCAVEQSRAQRARSRMETINA